MSDSVGRPVRNNNISERLLAFAAEIVKLCAELNSSFAGNHIFKQLIRSATSAGANYEEACGAESLADFIHKLRIVLKELRESAYWLKLSQKAELVTDQRIEGFIQEAQELANIIGKSIVTARSNASNAKCKMQNNAK